MTLDRDKLRKAAHRALQKARGAGDRRISVAANVIEFLAHGGMVPDDAKDAAAAAKRREERLRLASRAAAALVSNSTMLAACVPKSEGPLTALSENVARMALDYADALIAEVDKP